MSVSMRDVHPHIDYHRLSILLLLIILMAIIGSLTIGRDIYESGEKSLYSFGIVNFFGYLFVFFLMPMELAFIFYLRTGYDPVMLNLVAVFTAIASQTIDYLIGYFFSTRIIDQLIGRKRYEKAEDEIRRYGNWTLFFSNLLPLSSPIISLAAGMLKYRVKDALIYSTVGMICRYLLLTLLFH
jgi:membrane protein YqaA with SNARE-associated domain